MSEGRKDLIKELNKKLDERRLLYENARRDADREAEQYQEEMISALETAIFALREKEI